MSGLCNLPPQSNSILSIKEEIEIGERQLQEQIFHECEVKQSGADQSANFGKRSGIINSLCDDAEDAQPGLKDCEMKSGTIKEQLFEHNLSSKNSINSTQILREKNHTCSICAKKFRWRCELEAHMISHCGTRPYACTICPKRFTAARSLNRHMFTCGDNGKFRSRYKCTVCEKSFSRSEGLNSHMNIHRGERPFKCDICNKSFARKSTLYSHNRTHSRDKKFECALCNKTFIYASNHRRHEKLHSNGRLKYQCDICKHYFWSDYQYRSHLEGNKCKGNPQESNMHTVRATETRFQCSKCDHESFASIELLNRHKVQSHLPSKTHSCSVCGKAYTHKFRLEIHMNSHTGSRPYTCTICPKSFFSLQSLYKHNKSHDILSAKADNCSRFKCEKLCEKLCSSRDRLNSHMNMHRRKRPFKCDTCPKTFMSPDTLSSHKKLHADDGVGECTLCNQKFTDSNKRRRHEKTHTNISKYQCAKCKKYFRLEDQHRSHLEDNKCKGYASEQLFECSKCENESFVSIELLNQHKVEVHPPPKKNHACSICEKSFRSSSRLKVHMNVHTGNRPYKCTVCPKKYGCPQSLRQHKLDHNFLSADGKIRGRFKCTLCEKSYYSKTNLNSHMHFHRGERPYKCEICPKSYTSAKSLRSHIKTHSDERKYECNFDRRVDEKSHTNSRMKYRCEKCKMYFRLKNQYGSHLKDNKCKGYALDKPFQCSKGDNESFATIENLIRHKAKDKCNRNCQESDHIRENKKCETQVHSETKNIQNDEQSQKNDAFEKKYKCVECKKEFICKRNLNFHLRSHLQIASM